MRYTFSGARLVDATIDLPHAALTVNDRRILAVQSGESAPSDASIDAGGMLLVPGFLDMHTHGGGGYSLHTPDPDEIRRYARWVACTGVTGFLAGVVGVPGGLPAEQLRAAAMVASDAVGDAVSDAPGDTLGARMLGIHLEGPYLSHERRGAHLASWLRVPNPAETEHLLALCDGHLRVLTAAPELPGVEALIRRMTQAGVTVSIGHTNATYEQTRAAIAWGARCATHCANGMRPLHQREPGPLAAIAEAPEVYGELIADGCHLHPAMLRLLLRLLGPERAILITDALRGAGTEAKQFELNGRVVRAEDGAARLSDGTLAGSVLTMDQALRNARSFTDLSLSESIGMLTRNPAAVARIAQRKGMLTPGFDADLALLDASLCVQATIRGGRLIYATPAWRERLARLPGSEHLADPPVGPQRSPSI